MNLDDDVKQILKLSCQIRSDPGFQDLNEEDVQELIESMDEEVSPDEALELAEEAGKKDQEEEKAAGEEESKKAGWTIPKLREAMDHVEMAIQIADENDEDVERSRVVKENLTHAFTTYKELLNKLTHDQNQKKITTFFKIKSQGELIIF